MTRVEVRPGEHDDRIELSFIEGGDILRVTAGFNEWATNDATVASAGWRKTDARQLAVDVIFIETPHRLHLLLDLSNSTFTLRWETEPLHEIPLRSMRKPTALDGQPRDRSSA